MCRCKDEHSGGRRCPSDNSESRRLRLHKAKIIETYSPLALKPSFSDTETISQMEKDVSKPFTVETVKETIIELNNIIHNQKHWTQAAGIPETQQWLLTVDQHLIEIGIGVEYLAETKYDAPTDAFLSDMAEKIDYQKLEIADEYDDQIKTLHETISKLRNDLTDSDTQHALHVEECFASEGITRETHPVISERWAELEKRNPQLHQQLKTSTNPADEIEEQIKHTQQKIDTLREEKFSKIKELELRYDSPLGEAYRKRNKAIHLALQEVGVNFAESEDLKISSKSHQQATKTINSVTHYYPKSWVEASNEYYDQQELKIVNTKQRAHYKENVEQINRTSSTFAYFTEKPADWKPDPYSLHDSEYQPVDENNQWVDPASKVAKQADPVPAGLKNWVQVQYVYKQWDDSLGEPPAKLKGYTEKHQFWEEKFDPETHKMYRTGKLITYFRKPKTKTVVNNRSLVAELTISDSGVSLTNKKAVNTRVALHELAHRMEVSNPHVAQMERAFLLRRAGFLNGNPEKLSNIYQGTREKGYKDNFINHYMGKVYDGRTYEILSMGMETLFEGSHGAFIGQNGEKRDPDYKRAILGMLASAAVKKTNN